MIDMIESIMGGNDEYVKALRAAKPFWDKFYAGLPKGGSIQNEIDHSQPRFEHEMQNSAGLQRPFAKSIMPLTAIASLYEDGFEDEDFARQVVNAMIGSNVLSVEVKGNAEDVKELYGL